MMNTPIILHRAVALLWLLGVGLWGLGLSGLAAPALAEAIAPYPQIVVSGQGSVEVAPDLAVLELTVTREAATAQAALAANSAAMGEVLAAMRTQGVAEGDLRTSGFSIQPNYVHSPRTAGAPAQPPRIVGYTVRNSLTVRVRDVGRVGAILDNSVTLGVNEGGHILFTNDDPSIALARARAEAMQEALAKATMLAEAAGVKPGRVLQISEQSYNPTPMPMGMAMARSAEAVPVAAGVNSYSVTVNLTIAIIQ